MEQTAGSAATRAQCAVTLYNMANSTDRGINFKQDQRISLNWAASEGVMAGKLKGDGTVDLDPGGSITRQDMITAMYRMQLKNDPEGVRDAVKQGSTALNQFSDRNDVSVYARQAMAWAVGSGLVQGDGQGHLDPRGVLTVDQMTALGERYGAMEMQGQDQYVPLSQLVAEAPGAAAMSSNDGEHRLRWAHPEAHGGETYAEPETEPAFELS